MTRMNAYAGTVIVPLLARLVLCAALFTAGWIKLMTTVQFTGGDAALLIEHGVVDEVQQATMRVRPSAWTQQQEPAHEDAPQAEQPPAEQAPDEQPLDEPTDDTPTIRERIEEAVELPPDVLVEDPVTGEDVVIAKRLHGITVTLIRNTDLAAPWPRILAWMAALTELVGGALLLIGLFSRVWALGIAILLGTAFYLTSLGPLIDLNLFGIALDVSAFNRLYAQAGLFVLAIGIVFTGPGPLSLDRLIFRPAPPPADVDYPD
jgi:putative oxidoreductase